MPVASSVLLPRTPILGLLLLSCAPPAPITVAPDTTVTLAPGERAQLRGSDLTLTFVRVVRDDRCPLGVFCIRFGDARVAFRVRQARQDTLLVLSTADTATPATVGAYRIALDALAPIRRQETTIPDTTYRATVILGRIGTPSP
jgi:hypothetical protein